MSKTYLEKEKAEICLDPVVNEIKLTCTSCPRQCEMTLLMEGLSVLMVKDDGCKKGTKFAYKEMKNRKKAKPQKVGYHCEMDRIEEAV